MSISLAFMEAKRLKFPEKNFKKDQKNRKKHLPKKILSVKIRMLASGMMRKVAGIGRRVISTDHGREASKAGEKIPCCN